VFPTLYREWSNCLNRWKEYQEAEHRCLVEKQSGNGERAKSSQAEAETLELMRQAANEFGWMMRMFERYGGTLPSSLVPDAPVAHEINHLADAIARLEKEVRELKDELREAQYTIDRLTARRTQQRVTH
jgi:hypothetical protein